MYSNDDSGGLRAVSRSLGDPIIYYMTQVSSVSALYCDPAANDGDFAPVADVITPLAR